MHAFSKYICCLFFCSLLFTFYPPLFCDGFGNILISYISLVLALGIPDVRRRACPMLTCSTRIYPPPASQKHELHKCTIIAQSCTHAHTHTQPETHIPLHTSSLLVLRPTPAYSEFLYGSTAQFSNSFYFCVLYLGLHIIMLQCHWHSFFHGCLVQTPFVWKPGQDSMAINKTWVVLLIINPPPN